MINFCFFCSLSLICRNQVLTNPFSSLFHLNFRPLSYPSESGVVLAALFRSIHSSIVHIYILRVSFHSRRSLRVVQQKKKEEENSNNPPKQPLCVVPPHLIFGFNYSKLYKFHFLKGRKERVFLIYAHFFSSPLHLSVSVQKIHFSLMFF